MSDAIITALITGFTTLAVCMVSNHYQMRQTDQKQQEAVGMISYKLEELTKRVEKHNKVVERTFIVEKRLDVLEERGKVANQRIDDLEHMNH